MNQSEQTVSALAGSVAMVEQKLNALEMIFAGMQGAGMSFGGGSGGGGKGGDRSRGVLEFKAIQFMKPLGGDKSGLDNGIKHSLVLPTPSWTILGT